MSQPSTLRLEHVGGAWSTFHELRVEGNELFHEWGRIGGKATTQRKPCASPEAALAELERIATKKERKGYVRTAQTALQVIAGPSNGPVHLEASGREGVTTRQFANATFGVLKFDEEGFAELHLPNGLEWVVGADVYISDEQKGSNNPQHVLRVDVLEDMTWLLHEAGYDMDENDLEPCFEAVAAVDVIDRQERHVYDITLTPGARVNDVLKAIDANLRELAAEYSVRHPDND